jgi:hypothetical protein
VSEALLMARLLVKPIVGTFFTMFPAVLVTSSVVAVVGGWLWWLLVRQPPAREIGSEASQ